MLVLLNVQILVHPARPSHLIPLLTDVIVPPSMIKRIRTVWTGRRMHLKRRPHRCRHLVRNSGKAWTRRCRSGRRVFLPYTKEGSILPAPAGWRKGHIQSKGWWHPGGWHGYARNLYSTAAGHRFPHRLPFHTWNQPWSACKSHGRRSSLWSRTMDMSHPPMNKTAYIHWKAVWMFFLYELSCKSGSFSYHSIVVFLEWRF